MLSNDYIIGGDSDNLGEAVPFGCITCGGCKGCEGCSWLQGHWWKEKVNPSRMPEWSTNGFTFVLQLQFGINCVRKFRNLF